jgi:hypothetical protein
VTAVPATEAVLEVSARLLQSARAGAWDSMTADVTQRENLLRALPLSGEKVREALETLQLHNEEIRALASNARDAVSQQLSEQQRNHRALNTYLHNAER